MAIFGPLFDVDGFPPRWQCGSAWTPFLGWAHIISDVAIFAAYYAIPISLAYFVVRRRHDLPFPKIFILFMLFIASCGTVHLIEASIFWWPAYRLSALGKVITAVVSWATVIALVPTIPKALSLPGLEKRNAEMEREIASRKLVEARLRELTAALEQSNEDLERFAHVASHDLQEPLRKIEAFGTLMEEDFPNLEPACLEHIGRIRGSAGRMRRMITDLLAFSRLAQQHDSGLRQPIDLNEMLKDVIDDLQMRARERDAQIHVDHLPTVFGTRIHLRQLFQNLIDNAIKFHSPERPPEIHISATRAAPEFGPEAWCIRIADNGIGFDAAIHTERIFEPFQRLHSRDIYPGNGIGLAICKRIMEQIDGHITVESKPGEGTTFLLTFVR